MNREDVSFAKTSRGETCGGAIYRGNQLVVRERTAGYAVNQCGPVTKSRSVFEYERGDRCFGNFDVRVRTFENHLV